MVRCGSINPGGAGTSAIYNLFDQYYIKQEGGWLATGMIATGGVVSDYVEPGPGNVYRAHVFSSTGTFQVTSVGGFGASVDWLCVAGGGGGGGNANSPGRWWCWWI